MGFGYGQTTYHSSDAYSRESGERVAKSFTSDMVAHVWAQRSQTFGRNGTGNFYFEGDALFSYGSHFLCAYLLPVKDSEVTSGDVLALHTLESHSPTTSGHCSTARHAASHLPGAWIPRLTMLRKALPVLAQSVGDARHLQELAKAGERDERRALEDVRAWLDSFDIGEPGERCGGSYAVDGVAVICRAAGISKAEVARIQSKRAKRIAAERAAEEKSETAHQLHTAKRIAAMTDSQFAEQWPDDGSRTWESGNGSKPYELERSLKLATELNRAARAARSKGWTRVAGEVTRKEKQLRAHVKGRNARIIAANRKARADDVRAWRAGTGSRPPAYLFNAFPAIQRALERGERLERAGNIAAAFASWQAGEGSRPYLNDFEAGTPEFEAVAESIRIERRGFKASATVWLADSLAPSSACPELSTNAAYCRLPGDESERTGLKALQRVTLAEKETREQRERQELSARRRADWLAGAANYWRGDDGEGGALMRINGETLETSQGASVPLAHAVKVFAFVKACREAGKSWKRNGATIRVGHFQVDSVEPSGNFRAGCHAFNWPEVERIARIAGVFDIAPIPTPALASA